MYTHTIRTDFCVITIQAETDFRLQADGLTRVFPPKTDGYITLAGLSLYVTLETMKMQCAVLKFHAGYMRRTQSGNSFLKIGNNKNMMPRQVIKTIGYRIVVCPVSLSLVLSYLFGLYETALVFHLPCLAYLSMMEALCETLSILSWRAANACGFCIAWSLTLPENNMPSPALKMNALNHYSSVKCLKVKACLYCTQSFPETNIQFKGSMVSTVKNHYCFMFIFLDFHIVLSRFARLLKISSKIFSIKSLATGMCRSFMKLLHWNIILAFVCAAPWISSTH